MANPSNLFGIDKPVVPVNASIHRVVASPRVVPSYDLDTTRPTGSLALFCGRDIEQDQIYATVTPQHSNRAAGLDLAAWAIVFRPASKEDACAGSSRSIVASRQSALQNGIDGARKFDACAETTTREDQDPR